MAVVFAMFTCSSTMRLPRRAQWLTVSLHFMTCTVSATFAFHACICACMCALACSAGGSVNTNAGVGAILAGGHHDNLKLNLNVWHWQSLIKPKSVRNRD